MALLSVLALCSSSGCLVAEAPDYDDPKRTTPIIDATSVVPSPYRILEVPETGPKQTFTIPVRSEDSGDHLRTAFFLDYGSASPTILDKDVHSPGTLDQWRLLPAPVQLAGRVPPGCRQLTLLVLHDPGWDKSADLPDPDLSKGDVASISWWMNVAGAASEVERACPRPTSTVIP